jgi:hypothetical protein
VNFRFDVPATAPAGSYALSLANGLGDPPLSNTLVHASAGFAPVLANGSLEVVEEPPPPPTPEARLSVNSLEAAPGDTGKKAAVRLTSNVSLEAFTVVLAFDPRAVQVTGIDLEGTAVAALSPEFASPLIQNEAGYAAMGVAIDFLPPFDERSLPAGSDLPLVNFRFDVPATAPGGSYALSLANGLGDPPLSNVVVHASASIAPTLANGSLEVIAPPPPNPTKLWIDPVEAEAGSQGKASVHLTTVEAIDAFTVVGIYDPEATRVTGFDLAGSITGSLAPEFVIPSIHSAENFFAYTVIFDFTPPFEEQQIPPGEGQLLLRIVFDVPESATLGEHLLGLRNDLGNPPLSNSLAAGGKSLFPDLTDGMVTVVAPPPPPPAPKFVRGDANDSGRVDVADYIYLLSYLYNSGTPPPCLEAADVDDSTFLNATDPVLLIEYIFRGGDRPLPPFPSPGEDPTPDDLGCLRGS